MLSKAPVMASKPVAKTMLSSSYSAARVRTPRGVIASIGVAAEIDQGDVVAVERLVVVGVDADALGAEGIVLGDERLGDGGVADRGADLGAEELGGGVVGLLPA